jgi:hypothetical protein
VSANLRSHSAIKLAAGTNPITTASIFAMRTAPCTGSQVDCDRYGKNGGNAQFNFNHDECNQAPDSASFSDSGSGVNFQATQVTAATFDQAAHTVTLTGTGTDNGHPVAFTIVAADSSLAPPGLFSITLIDGYSNSGNLLDGSVTVY